MTDTNDDKTTTPEDTTTPEETTSTVTATAAATGTVKNFDVNRRYGFITHEDGTQVFVHQTDLLEGTIIAAGDRVTFQVTQGEKGPRAVSVRKL